ncbi:MAG TPA: TlpA disulfide reductase family protein [Ilumatobacteraceae bacterium]
MSKQSTRARRAAPPPPKKTVWWPWALLAGLVVVALVIAIASTLGSDEKVTEGTGGSAAETQSVTVVGDPLPKQTASGLDSSPVGLAAPTLHGFNFDGSSVDITPGGTAKMIVFLAHWCPHCNNEIPVLNAWRDTGQMPAGLDVIGVSTAANAQSENYPPSAWITRKQWTWPVLADSADGTAAQAYGLGGFPTFVIVGTDGKVKLRYSGEAPQEVLTTMVNQALAT